MKSQEQKTKESIILAIKQNSLEELKCYFCDKHIGWVKDFDMEGNYPVCDVCNTTTFTIRKASFDDGLYELRLSDQKPNEDPFYSTNLKELEEFAKNYVNNKQNEKSTT